MNFYLSFLIYLCGVMFAEKIYNTRVPDIINISIAAIFVSVSLFYELFYGRYRPILNPTELMDNRVLTRL